jgi:hypothetical protein
VAKRKDETANERKGRTERKEYSRPKIVHTETLTARATVCGKADSTCEPVGSIQS